MKNDSGKIFKVMNSIETKARLILTGTPLQNNIDELFNLLFFLGIRESNDSTEWKEKYETLEADNIGELHKEIQPYFLRRTRKQELDLPPKAEVELPIPLTLFQKKLYVGLLENNKVMLKSIVSKLNSDANIRRSGNVLMELRKICGHPFLIENAEPTWLEEEVWEKAFVEASGKLMLLAKMLPKLKEDGHRVLIFSQFKLVLDILEEFLEQEEHSYVRLDGSTPTIKRTPMIDSYNKPGSDIFCFLLTTRTGGMGINLTSADTIIIFGLLSFINAS